MQKIYEKIKRRDFGESMSDETKFKVLNFIVRQLRVFSVDQKKQLLIDFWDWYCDHPDPHIDTKFSKDEMINEFLLLKKKN